MFFLSAFMGGCFSILTPLFYLNKIGKMLFVFGSCIWFVCISFRFHTFKKFVQIYLLQLLSMLIYYGAMLMISKFFSTESVIEILIGVIAIYFVVRWLFAKIARKENVQKFCCDIEIQNGKKSIKCRAFLDSGNLLYDPLTQNPVCLLNFKVFEALFQEISLEDILRRSAKVKSLHMAHYIAFNTLNSSDKILVFQVEKLKLNGKEIAQATMGLVLRNFDQAFGSDVILHNNFASISGG